MVFSVAAWMIVWILVVIKTRSIDFDIQFNLQFLEGPIQLDCDLVPYLMV